MSETTSSPAPVDRYVRDELTTDEMAEFEMALMKSPVLQEELETVLGLREALLLGTDQQPETEDLLPQSLSGSGNWHPVALVATVVLAVFSTVMFWKTSNDSAGLQQQIDLLSQPRTEVLTVPVKIMRSSGNRTPDVVVRKPDGHAAILLNIELSPSVRQLDTVHFSLRDHSGHSVQTWAAAPSSQGYVSVMVISEQVPAEQLWLEMSSEGGELVDRRLLEFR